jgi:hypothetical protein
LRIECDHRLQQSGTFLPIVVRFRAASAKTNNRKMGKYHAAAGKYQLEADHRVTRVNNRTYAVALSNAALPALIAQVHRFHLCFVFSLWKRKNET